MELLKIIFSEEITKLSLSNLKQYRAAVSGNVKAVAKLDREIKHQQGGRAAWLKEYYSKSVGGVSLQKYNKAKANGTLTVIEVG